MVSANGANQKFNGVLIVNFAGGFIDLGKFLSKIRRDDNVWIGNKAARVSPPTPEVAESLRNGLLMGFVEVFAEVRAAVHLPFDHVFRVFMEGQQLLICLVYDSTPDSSELISVLRGGRQVEVDMGMGSATGLELSDPQVGQEGKLTPGIGQKDVKVSLELSTVNRPDIVIGAAELRAEEISGIGSGETKSRTRLVRKALQGGALP